MKFKGSVNIKEPLTSAQLVYSPLMHVREFQTSGTYADTAGTRFAIHLNDIVLNEISGATLNSSTGDVSLPSGEYYIRGYITGWRCDAHRAEIRNEFAKVDTTFLIGPTFRAVYDGSTPQYTGSMAIVQGYVQFLSTQKITLYHNVMTTTSAYNGVILGVTGEDEHYSNLLIWKLS